AGPTEVSANKAAATNSARGMRPIVRWRGACSYDVHEPGNSAVGAHLDRSPRRGAAADGERCGHWPFESRAAVEHQHPTGHRVEPCGDNHFGHRPNAP